MITRYKLYDSTNYGLDIFEIYFPDARNLVKNKEAFKLRNYESEASCYFYLYENRGNGTKYYTIKDFGEPEKKLISPIDLHMERTGLNYPEAIADLAARFGIYDGLCASVNKPDIRKEPAGVDMPEGFENLELLENFTDEMCEIMGPAVTCKNLEALNWHPVRYIVTVKNRQKTFRFSNERYPIFARECVYTETVDGVKKDRVFYKIYEPLNPEKKYRFRYMPRGVKPKDYINGLAELRRDFLKQNEKARADWEADPINENKPYQESKLEAVAICSGERDSLCALSQGLRPIWLNSETAELSPMNYAEISKYADKIYNIPDIDDTGIRCGKALALKFPDIHTVWLPSDLLSKYTDNRGRTRKDLRDWMELRPTREDFKKLLAAALPAKFWSSWSEVNQKTGRVTKKCSINALCLLYFLNLKNYYTYKGESGKEVNFIRIDGNVVQSVLDSDIRHDILDWAEAEGLDMEVRTTLVTSPLLSAGTLTALKSVELDFANYTEHSQWFYFKNAAVEVCANGLRQVDFKREIPEKFVWERCIFNHDFRMLPDMFKITHSEEAPESKDFHIELLDVSSNYMKYLINSCRIYWREEMEYRFEDRNAAREYAKSHKFDIAGEGLTPEQIQEQEQALINRIFIIGYMLHRYKSPSKPWSPYLMDNLIGENNQCNGGSGKSFMFKALEHFTELCTISGKNIRVFDNTHWAERITKNTGIVLVDDLAENFPMKQLYDTISGSVVIDKKNVVSYELGFNDTPKFCMTTNFVPREFNPSTVRRTIYGVVSDYYHSQSPENDYLETRSIADDFDGDLMREGAYSEEDWNADANFVMQCVRFYLSVAPLKIKIEPKLDNIMHRKLAAEMNDCFRDWAEQYFSEDGDNLDRFLIRQDVAEDFRHYANLPKSTMQTFSRALSAFCTLSEHIDTLNPEEFCNGAGRIIRRIKSPDGLSTKSAEMIYVRSAKAAAEQENTNRLTSEAADVDEPF